MRSPLILALVVVLALAVAGCGGGNDKSKKSKAPRETAVEKEGELLNDMESFIPEDLGKKPPRLKITFVRCHKRTTKLYVCNMRAKTGQRVRADVHVAPDGSYTYETTIFG